MSPVEARTVPTPGAPASNGNRHGRPFTLRMEPGQEDVLRRKLAELELQPFATRPAELFGHDAGGGYGRRRASFGWFLVWAALQWAQIPDAKPGKTGGELPGKTRRGRARRPSTSITRRTGKTSAIARKRAAKRGRKGGRR